MLERRAAKSPQRVLQAFGQSHVAFTAEDDVRMFEA